MPNEIIIDQNVLQTVPAGEYDVIVSKAGYATQTQRATILSSSLTTLNFYLSLGTTAYTTQATTLNTTGTTLAPPGSLYVSSATGTFNWSVNGTSVSGNQTSGQSATSLAPGNYVLTGTSAGKATLTRSFTITSGQNTTVSLTFVNGTTAAPGPLYVYTNRDPGFTWSVGDTNVSGYNKAQGEAGVNLPSGNYTLMASATGYTDLSVDFQMLSGQNNTIQLDFNQLATTTLAPGFIRVAANAGTFNWSINGTSVSGDQNTPSSSLSLPLAPGNYTLTGTSPGKPTLTQTITITSAQVLVVNLTFAVSTTAALGNFSLSSNTATFTWSVQGTNVSGDQNTPTGSLPPGIYNVVGNSTGKVSIGSALVITSGQTTTLNINFVDVGLTPGFIRVSGNAPTFNYSISGTNVSGNELTQTNSSPIPPGSHTLTATSPLHVTVTQTITIISGQVLIVNLDFLDDVGYLHLTSNITDFAWSFVGSGNFAPPSSEHGNGVGGGAAAIDSPGNYVLTATSPGKTTITQPFTLISRQITTVDLTFALTTASTTASTTAFPYGTLQMVPTDLSTPFDWILSPTGYSGDLSNVKTPISLPQGFYNLTVISPGKTTLGLAVDMISGQTTTVNITLVALTTASTTHSTTASPTGTLQVFSSPSIPFTWSANGGSATATGDQNSTLVTVPVGSYTINGQAINRQPTGQVVSVVAGQNTQVTLIFV